MEGRNWICTGILMSGERENCGMRKTLVSIF
jgi:hypothetical protein